MDFIGLVHWIQEHWDDLVFIYTSIVGIASIVIKLIPTLKKDNPALPVVKAVGKYVALNRESPTKRPA